MPFAVQQGGEPRRIPHVRLLHTSPLSPAPARFPATQFTQHLFTLEQEEYMSEGIDWTKVGL
jgi:hypothetical protein